MQRLTFLGPINAHTGYGLHSIQIIRDLGRLAPAAVAVRPFTYDDAFCPVPADIKEKFVHSAQPERGELMLMPPYEAPTPGKRSVYFTMWETTRLPPGSVDMLNRAECVVVPSSWNACCFDAQGVDVPIRIVPLGIKTDIFCQRPPALRPEMYGHRSGFEEVRFGTAARARHGGVRKGFTSAVRTFKRAFPKETDVRLSIKCFPDDPPVETGDDRIELHREFWNEQRLAMWFTDIDCFVSLVTAEGWGLMQHQAMSVGRVVIAPAFSGLTEFYGESNGLPVRYKLVPASEGYFGNGLWAQPDEDDCIDRMRWVYANRIKAWELGAWASKSVAHLTWDNHSRCLLKVCQEFGLLESVRPMPRRITKPVVQTARTVQPYGYRPYIA